MYNYGAEKAKYPYLLFVHEDVEFLTADWGKTIEGKMSEEDCGVVGFAGSKYIHSVISGWFSGHSAFDCSNFHYYYKGKMRHMRHNAFSDFENVVTLDGLALFVRKDVWRENPFDEQVLKGFHCYDLDFSMHISRSHKNYVSFCVDVLHKSNGFYDKKWLDASYKLHNDKWGKLTPLGVGGLPNEEARRKIEDDLTWRALKVAYRYDSPHLRHLIKEYRRLPFSIKHLERCFRILVKYNRKK